MSDIDKTVQLIIKYTKFLNEHGYVVSPGRSSSPQLKTSKKSK